MGCGWDGGEGLVPAGPPAAVWADLPCLPVPPSPAYTHVQGSVLTAAVSRSPDRPSCSTVAPTPPLCQPGSRHSHTWETAAATTRFSSYHPGHKVPTRESHPPGGPQASPHATPLCQPIGRAALGLSGQAALSSGMGKALLRNVFIPPQKGGRGPFCDFKEEIPSGASHQPWVRLF